MSSLPEAILVSCCQSSTATCFQDTVAMDLKFYKGKILLHLIDHATHLSACTRVPSKHQESIIKGIFTHWISVYGPAKQFLKDNGGEFVNEDFVTLCESLTELFKPLVLRHPGLMA